MIFVTVGTHEQQFDRLVKYMDKWAEKNEEEVVIQSGFSIYTPVCCNCEKILSYEKMIELVKNARIVVTHGGPSSFIMPLQYGKVPIVVPRQKKYNEHVNDHQVDFCREVFKRMNSIIVVEDIESLGKTLFHYDEISKTMRSGNNSNNCSFCTNLEKIVEGMF